MKPEIILTAKGHAGTMATLQSEFTAHNLFEASDKDSFFEKCATRVRGLATFGPLPVDGTAASGREIPPEPPSGRCRLTAS